MRILTTLLLAFSTSTLFGLFSPNAQASEWDKKTIVTFNEPVEIPGIVMLPGSYVFNLENTSGDRNIVQIWSGDNMHLIATIMTVLVSRTEPTEDSIFTFEQRQAGAPEAIATWYFPGDTTGQGFIYPHFHVNSHSASSSELK